MKVTGVALSPEIDEMFVGPELKPDPLNAKWRVVGEMPSCIFIVRPEHKWWVNWTLPDKRFTVQGNPAPVAGSPCRFYRATQQR